jgi:anti-sigma factor ChrR (cupin superfamily)
VTVDENAMIIENLFDAQTLIADREWRSLTEGVLISLIYDRDGGSRAAFLHYQPGASVPNHRHMGFEHILILQGAQNDGEKTYRAGTLVIHPPGTQHHLVAPEGCLALGIWERAVAFT